MKHSLLALTVASAVSVTAVQAPVAWSEETQQAAPDKANSSGSSDGEELSPAAIAGITLGVLAAVGAGAAFAVSQGPEGGCWADGVVVDGAGVGGVGLRRGVDK